MSRRASSGKFNHNNTIGNHSSGQVYHSAEALAHQNEKLKLELKHYAEKMELLQKQNVLLEE